MILLVRQKVIRAPGVLVVACLLTAVLAACSTADREPSPATRSPSMPEGAPGSRLTVATAVCDTVATRWREANLSTTRSDSVAKMISMTGSAPVCIVTAIGESDSAVTIMRRGYWADSAALGWRGIADWDADGPDGMSRTLIRTGVRCQVDGEWDGGDDSDPTAERSKRVVVRTTCWSDTTRTAVGSGPTLP